MFIFFIYIHRVRIFILFDLSIGHQTRLGVTIVMLRAVLKFNLTLRHLTPDTTYFKSRGKSLWEVKTYIMDNIGINSPYQISIARDSY